jgi:hypothetical protein
MISSRLESLVTTSEGVKVTYPPRAHFDESVVFVSTILLHPGHLKDTKGGGGGVTGRFGLVDLHPIPNQQIQLQNVPRISEPLSN